MSYRKGQGRGETLNVGGGVFGYPETVLVLFATSENDPVLLHPFASLLDASLLVFF